jgi:hypothetical protein
MKLRTAAVSFLAYALLALTPGIAQAHTLSDSRCFPMGSRSSLTIGNISDKSVYMYAAGQINSSCGGGYNIGYNRVQVDMWLYRYPTATNPVLCRHWGPNYNFSNFYVQRTVTWSSVPPCGKGLYSMYVNSKFYAADGTSLGGGGAWPASHSWN